MRAISMAATSSFDCGGQASTPLAVTSSMVLRSPPMMPVCGDTSLARIQSQPLRASLALALAATFSVSAAKPITNSGRCDLRRAMVERMSGFSTSDNSGVVWPAFFLIFCSPALATRQSATAAAKIATSTGSARSAARSMSRAVSTCTTITPGGSGTFTGPLISVTLAPARRGRGGDGVALLAGRAVGDVAHRIDRLVRRTGGDQHALAFERLRAAAEQAFDRGGDLQRLGHAAQPALAGFRHLAFVRADERDAVGDELRQIALRRFVRPHMRVHRRRQQHLRAVASSTAVARSSACPPAILAIKSAVAGATTTRSVSRASRM